jgi:predicted amidohydrolase YtcJ
VKKKFIVISFIFSLITFSCSFFPKEADLILKNGHIYTFDKDNTIAEAVAIKNGKIEAVGTNNDILNNYKSIEVIDLDGKSVFPGFIDSHGHILGLGIALSTLDCSNAKSAEEVAQRVQEKAKSVKPGEWIVGRGWDQNTWKNKDFPMHNLLDAVAPDNPVFLVRIDGHAVWVNINTMILAGITPETREPDGGKILKYKDGEPTGVFIDNAISLIERVRPEMTIDQKEKCIALALEECSRYGLTEVHDMGIDSVTIKIYKKLIEQNKMPIRVYAFIEGTGATWDYYRKAGKERIGDDLLTIAGIKLYVDGALGSRGAALIDPYSDDPGNRGLTIISENELIKVAKEALDANLQVAVHCIGDRANSIALDAFEKALKEKPNPDNRFRIEHCQVLNPKDITRFKLLGIIPSMQPVHATSDMYWAEQRLGKDRIKYAYAWRSLLNTGVFIPGGSDFPVENPNPLAGIYAAFTRKNSLGSPEHWYKDRVQFSFASKDVDTTQFENGWYGFQKMNREEAVKSFTIWGAFAAFQEKIKGTIEADKCADFVILSDNIYSIDPEKILKTQVEMTIVGGKIVYKKDKKFASN